MSCSGGQLGCHACGRTTWNVKIIKSLDDFAVRNSNTNSKFYGKGDNARSNVVIQLVSALFYLFCFIRGKLLFSVYPETVTADKQFLKNKQY